MTVKHVILICEKFPGLEKLKKLLKGEVFMNLIIIFVIGILIGCVITLSIFRMRSVGSLRIDTSDPDDGPYLFLELSKDVSVVYQKRYVTLKVNTKSFIPHE